jgi:hypothetical protein
MIPAERLLGGLPLLAVPVGLAGRVLGQVSGGLVGRPAAAGPGPTGGNRGGGRGLRQIRAARHARHPGILSKGSVLSVPPKLVAVSLAMVTCAAGGTFAVAHAHRAAPPRAVSSAPAPQKLVVASPAPLATHTARLKQPKQSKPPAKKPTPPAATVTSERKGVSVWSFAGADQALAASGASW